jgi:hypothetical protein
MKSVRVRRHVRRHVQVPVKGAVPLYHQCEIPESGVNEHGIMFESSNWSEVRRKHGQGEKRRRLLNNLFEYLAQYRDAGIRVKEVGIYGSFISDKPDPGDIDVVILREPGGDLSSVWSYMAAKREHGIDSFSVVSRRHFCNALAHPRERGSKKVIRVVL